MDISKINQPLTQFSENLSKQIHIDKVFVFGSYSKGTATENSDIDVVVVSENFRGQDEFSRWKILDVAAHYISPEIQAWGFTQDELDEADELTTLGQARTKGIRVI